MYYTKDIVLICDDNYFMPTTVCIKSIIENTKSIGDLSIIVCSFGLSKENISFLESLGDKRIKVSAKIINEECYAERIRMISQKTHVTPAALIKFELPSIFSELDRILYVDSDIVIKDNIQELLGTNIDNSYLAASYEFWDHIERISYSLNKKVSESFYFNSGVMLLNLKKMREDNVPELLWDYKLNRSKTPRMDQESFNAICSKTAAHLSIKWNFNPAFRYRSYLNEINKVYHTNYSTIEQLEEDICVIHYVGTNDKPWLYETARMRSFWDDIFKVIYPSSKLKFKEPVLIKSGYLDSIIEKIKEHGFYGLFCNVIYKIKSLKYERTN